VNEPFLRVVRGEPTAAELAALVVVLAAAGPAAPEAEARSRWADRGAALRRPLHAGRGAWQAASSRR